RVTAEGRAGRRATPGAPVHGPAHIVERGNLDHQVHDSGWCRKWRQGQRVVPRVAAEEPHPERGPGWPAEQLRRHAHRVPQPESQHVGVETQRGLVVGHGQDNMAKPEKTGDETIPVRTHRRTVLERRPGTITSRAGKSSIRRYTAPASGPRPSTMPSALTPNSRQAPTSADSMRRYPSDRIPVMSRRLPGS